MQSTYTGVYKKGGPTCVEPGKRLSDLVDRSQANGMASRRASLGVSPLQAAPNGNSATNGRKPAPIVTSLVPTYSGRWAPLPHAGLLRCLTSRQTPTVSHTGLRKSSTLYTLQFIDTVIPDTGFASLQ